MRTPARRSVIDRTGSSLSLVHRSAGWPRFGPARLDLDLFREAWRPRRPVAEYSLIKKFLLLAESVLGSPLSIGVDT